MANQRKLSAKLLPIILTLSLFLTAIILINIYPHHIFLTSTTNLSSIEPSIHKASSYKLLQENKEDKKIEIIDNPFHLPNLGQKTSTMLTKTVEGTYDDVHIVFTTGCNGYQNWQSETLIYHWARIKHPGRITRIVAGCKDDGERSLANRTAVPNDDNRILFYFVPDYSPTEKDSKGVGKGHRPFHYFNKPYGMMQWITNEFDNIYENVIVLLDPDMIILRPFLFHIKEEADKFAEWQQASTSDGRSNNGKPRDLHVREGHPVSQKYGIGAKWVKWKGFCDELESCHPTDREAWRYYSVGPPYIMHKNDWHKVAKKWVDYSPLALEFEPQPSILAEMYSYVIGCAYYDLKHEYLFSMFSDPTSSSGMENVNNLDWSFINNKQHHDDYHLFHIIHMCQGYWLGQTRNEGTIRNGGYNWHKGHVPQEIMYNCEIPLFVELSDDDDELVEMYRNRDHQKDNRHYWILYHIYKYVNKAVLNYRLTYCSKEDNDKYLKYKLVLQQPEADKQTHRRMNYVLGEYDTKKSWRGH